MSEEQYNDCITLQCRQDKSVLSMIPQITLAA